MSIRFICASLPLLFLTACGGEPSGNGEEDLFAAGPFSEAAATIHAGADLAESRTLLLNNYGRVVNEATGRMDTLGSRQYIALTEELARDYPGDTLAALPLYKAAEVHQALGEYREAADIFDRVAHQYPGFSKSGEALFMLAFTYDENLKDYGRAKELYTRFRDEYPDNVFAENIDVLLDNLGKSSDEILQDLERRAAEQQ